MFNFINYEVELENCGLRDCTDVGCSVQSYCESFIKK